MERFFKVGTRTSPLALKQVEEILGTLEKHYPYIKIRVVGVDTHGDKDRSTPISKVEGTDFFTREIDEALLEKEIDFAVHSAKDLPDKPADGMVVAAMTDSIDPHDVLVSRSGLKINELPWGARIGTSSYRRKIQLRKYRRDFKIIDIRGNIDQRMQLVDKNKSGSAGQEGREVDAILIAAAGLIRLGMAEKITQKLPFEIIRPHPLQGALVVVARKEDKEVIDLLRVLDARNMEDFTVKGG
jgi:hydroxymethylbilane synthase